MLKLGLRTDKMGNIRWNTLAFTLFILIHACTGYVKMWNRVSNWGNPTNWDKQRLPCLGDNIILGDGAIFISQNLTVSSLELPTNGEILIGEGNELSFQDPATVSNNNCPNEDMFYIGSAAREWLNPLNWDLIENGVRSRHTEGMLYMDRVPCLHDYVTFPADDAFATRIDSQLQISSMQLSSGNLTNSAAQTYFSSTAGKLRFTFDGGSLALAEQACTLPEGCPCGTKQHQALVCRKFLCPAACASSVTPDNDCCSRCGALIKMKTSQGFNLRQCELKLRSDISNAAFPGVLLAVSPTQGATSAEVQILFTDPVGENSQTIGRKIYEELLTPSGSTKCPGYDVRFYPEEGGKGATDDDDTSTIVLAVVLTFVALAIIIVLIFFVWRRTRRGSFGMKRSALHNEMNIAGVQELDYVDTEFNGDAGHAKGASFENPVYNEMGYPGSTPGAGAGAVAALPAKKPMNGQKGATGIDNPVYDKEIDLGETTSNAPSTPGQRNPLYDDLYDEKKPPPDEDSDYDPLDDEPDSPELAKAKLKIELDDEARDDDDKSKGGGDSLA